VAGVVDFLKNAWAGRSGGNAQPRPVQPNVDEDEKQLVARCVEMLKEDQELRDRQTQFWRPCFEYYMGKQVPEDMPEWKSDLVLNVVASTIETTVSMLGQQRPRPEFEASEDEMDEYSEFMDKWFQDWWESQDMDIVSSDVDKAMLALSGVAYYYVDWCPFEKETICEEILPTRLWVSRGARDLQKARRVTMLRMMTRSELLQAFPEAEGKIVEGGTMISHDDRWVEETQPGFVSSPTSQQYGPRLDSGGLSSSEITYYYDVESGLSATKDEEIQVFYMWLKDYRTIRTHLMEMETGEEVLNERPMYPGGRLIVMACDRIIFDGPNPRADGKVPIVDQHCYRVPGRYYSKSQALDLLSPQDEINRTAQHLVDNRNLTGNNQYKYRKGSGIETAKIVGGMPGQAIPVLEMSDYEPIPVPPLPGYIADTYSMLMGTVERVSNIPAIAQGIQQKQMSGVAIEQLLSSVNVAVSFLITSKEQAIRNLGAIVLATEQQHNEQSRVVTITDPMTGAITKHELTPEQIRHGWGVKIATGSSVPLNRDSRMKMAIELGKLGIYDPMSVLESVNLPGARKILKRARMQQAQQHAMALEMAKAKAIAGGAPAGGGPPSPDAGAPPAPQAMNGQPVQSGPGGQGVY